MALILGTVKTLAAYAVAGRLSKGDMKVQSKITKVLQHMAHTHEQMARILDAERHVAVRMSQIVHDLPDAEPDFQNRTHHHRNLLRHPHLHHCPALLLNCCTAHFPA